jgi:uncharacterized damage-inducible protein DinB
MRDFPSVASCDVYEVRHALSPYTAERERIMNDAEGIFLDFSARKLEALTGRIESCLDRLNGEQIWARGGENENAVGNLALHLTGNVRQWIVSGIGGKPDVRERDSEFAARGGESAVELKEHLRATVSEAVAVIGSCGDRLTERVVIQKYEQSVLEAIYHVVEHFSMHTGQIQFATKMLTGTDLGFYAHLRTAAAHGEKTP